MDVSICLYMPQIVQTGYSIWSGPLKFAYTQLPYAAVKIDASVNSKTLRVCTGIDGSLGHRRITS